jgi:hypothetical protein
MKGIAALSAMLPILLVVAVSCRPVETGPREAGADKKTGTPSLDPLSAAWRFALAITNDPKDRAKCQERVATAHVKRGDAATAVKLAREIEGWRRGVVLAEAAVRFAEDGNTNDAIANASGAEAIAREIQDWQRDRIMVRAVGAAALLGKTETARQWSDFYASNRDYRGEIAAYHAIALARSGQVTNAVAVLEGLSDEVSHVDVATWRVNGYMLLAKEGHLSDPALITNILAKAWAASAQVGMPAARWDVQMNLADTAARCGEKALAEEWLENVTPLVLAEPSSAGALWAARLAVRWAALKNEARLEECSRAAEEMIARNQPIDQPAMLALLGEAWALAGDAGRADAFFSKATGIAVSLTNPRPRWMACVEVCLALERAGMGGRHVEDMNRRLSSQPGSNG